MMFSSRGLLLASRASQFRTMLRQQQNASRLIQHGAYQSPVLGFAGARRGFSDSALVTEEEQQQKTVGDLESEYARIGVDSQFSEQKHAYVLTFPWNFPEIVDKFEAEFKPKGGYWQTFVENTRAELKFHELYRVFHQSCALNDHAGVDHVCEGKLASAVKQSLDRIHFHGLDIEMANLRVAQEIQVLKVEISHGVSAERAENKALDQYSVSKQSLLGAPATYYKSEDQSVFDWMEADHRPYVVAVTALVESPMKLYVQNQNYSKVLFGSTDEEQVKNVVRFEANLRWTDFFKVMPTENKRPQQWKITDFNNLMNENPLFDQED